MSAPKETPRQKMIGMMYLVLTALLALNVDSAVLERFELINGTLENQIKTNQERNGATVKSIAATVSEKGNRDEDVAVLATATQVREKTKEVLQYVDEIKKEIVTETGGRDEETNMLVGAKNMETLANLMINQGKGKELKAKLDEHTTWLSGIVGQEFESLAKDGKDDEFYSQKIGQKNKNFSQIMFEMVPTAGGLASLSQLEGRLLDYEAEALTILSNQVGAKDLAFDVIVPMVLPESQLVAAGAKYKAKMFISASASGITPSMKLNGNPIPVDAEGFGEVEFTARADKYDENGQQRKSFTAEIEISGETYKEQIPYIVARPVISITSASVQALYRNCGNKLNVQVPALGAAYAPSFTAEGGTVDAGRGGQVTVIPTAGKVDLTVYSSSTLIGTQSFRVKAIPKPELVLKSGGREIDLKNGIQKDKMPREITLDAEPDPDFAEFLPDDARYRVSEWEVILARGQRAVRRKTVSGPRANIGDWVAVARPNDRLVVEAKQIQRRNFRGETENVVIGVNARIKNVPIN
jgi:gliding motility-associated protein GldM